LKNSSVAERLAASQEGLNTMNIVTLSGENFKIDLTIVYNRSVG
jgi:hypothetical protein